MIRKRISFVAFAFCLAIAIACQTSDEKDNKTAGAFDPTDNTTCIGAVNCNYGPGGERKPGTGTGSFGAFRVLSSLTNFNVNQSANLTSAGVDSLLETQLPASSILEVSFKKMTLTINAPYDIIFIPRSFLLTSYLIEIFASVYTISGSVPVDVETTDGLVKVLGNFTFSCTQASSASDCRLVQSETNLANANASPTPTPTPTQGKTTNQPNTSPSSVLDMY